MPERRASAVAGLAVTVMGAVPLLFLATAQPPAGAPAEPTTIAASAVPGLEAAPTEVHVAAATPHIAGVSATVGRVLAAAGFATAAPPGEIPESVARVLAANGITLAVKEDG